MTSSAATSATAAAAPVARGRWMGLSALVVVCIVLDQITKRIAVEHLADREPMSFLGDTLRITYTLNTGAFLGLGSGWSPEMRFWVLTVGTSAFLAVMVWVLFRNRSGSLFELVALALVVGGGLGNMIDRLFHEGAVIDFLNMGIGTLRTGIFNVADAAITAGVLMLLLQPLVVRRREAAASQDPSASS